MRSAISSELLQVSANGGRDIKGTIVDTMENIVDLHVRHLSEPQAPPAPQVPAALQVPPAPQAPHTPTGLAAQPLTAAPHVPELPTAAAKTSRRDWFVTGDRRVSVLDRIALLERAPTSQSPLLITVTVCSVFFLISMT